VRAPGLSRASFPIIVVLCGGVVIFVQKKSFARFACTQSAFLIERQKTQNVVLLDVPSKECRPQILGDKTERAKIHPNAPAKEDAILFFFKRHQNLPFSFSVGLFDVESTFRAVREDNNYHYKSYTTRTKIHTHFVNTFPNFNASSSSSSSSSSS